MSKCVQKTPRFWEKLVFSDLLASKSVAGKIAYTGLVAALCIVTNMFEIKFASVQYSLTVFSSVLAGMLAGPLLGFGAVFLGDGLGYLYNGAGFPYYWWVALSCATMALLAGAVVNVRIGKGKKALYIKLAIICVLTFAVCSVGINTTGMYYLGLPLYFPQNVRQAVEEVFGGEFSFGIYFVIRFFILGQIWNSLVNYALLFVALPLLSTIKSLGIC
ncbi:MAG: ECF transporter S component [Clostridia bacterium]|nr:ECF transporter S component [Clostridia bacterium]